MACSVPDKAITYNRSDCSYLSEEQFAEPPQTLDLLSQALPDLAGLFTEVKAERKSRAFDNSKVSAHTAIISTAVKIDLAQLSAAKRAVYLAIVKRYVAQFLSEKRYLSAFRSGWPYLPSPLDKSHSPRLDGSNGRRHRRRRRRPVRRTL